MRFRAVTHLLPVPGIILTLSPDQGAIWAEREFGGAGLGDLRRTKRLIKISAKFAGNIYDYSVTAQRLKIDVLVRAAWDRRLAPLARRLSAPLVLLLSTNFNLLYFGL